LRGLTGPAQFAEGTTGGQTFARDKGTKGGTPP
jgi:hypothetical protein